MKRGKNALTLDKSTGKEEGRKCNILVVRRSIFSKDVKK